jgi:hypothetical protein
MKLQWVGGLALLGVTASLGCATVEEVHRPPTPVEIGRINDAASENGSLTVDVLPPRDLTVDHVARSDGRTIELVPKTGATLSIPLDEVSGFSLHRGARGAAIGAGVGAGVALVEILGLVATAALLNNSGLSDPGAPQSSGCDDKCTEFIVGISVIAMGVGAIVGAVIGSPKHFPLNLGPATNP